MDSEDTGKNNSRQGGGQAKAGPLLTLCMKEWEL